MLVDVTVLPLRGGRHISYEIAEVKNPALPGGAF
jgi:hypothetical protein